MSILFALVFKSLVFIFVLGVLVTVHELGHFLAAKLFHVGVLEFSVGFGRKLIGWRRGETNYSIRLIPLGGYVRMVGDDPRIVPSEDDPKFLELEPDHRQLWLDQSRWFLKQGFWPKFLIVFAGPAFNFILAFALSFCSIGYWGVSDLVDEPIIGAVAEGYPAAEAGLKAGDRVLTVGDKKPTNWIEMADSVLAKAQSGVDLTVQRGDEVLSFRLAGKLDDAEASALLGSDRKYRIGIAPKYVREPVSLVESAYYATVEVGTLSYLTLRGIVKMISGFISPRNIRGPIYIFGEAGKVAEKGIEPLLRFLMVLSVSLAVLNLLPIPILDGGHLLIFTIEAIMGESLSLEAQERASQFGLILLLGLMMFAVGNDLWSIAGGS